MKRRRRSLLRETNALNTQKQVVKQRNRNISLNTSSSSSLSMSVILTWPGTFPAVAVAVVLCEEDGER